MAKFAITIVVLLCFSGATNAYTVAAYVEAKKQVAQGSGSGTKIALAGYHQGIAETVRSFLLAPPAGKILGGGWEICLDPDLVNRQLIEDVIARNLPDDIQNISDLSPSYLAWAGLVRMASCK